MTRWPELRVNVSRFRRHDDPASPDPIDIETDVAAGDDLAISTARVPAATRIRVVGALTAAADGVEFRGRADAPWEGECRRCLELVTGRIGVDLDATFVPGVVGDDSDTYSIVDDHADVGEVLYEELMLALPLSPLCREACPGADPDRFPTASGDDTGDEDMIDPRWAALDELEFDDDDARED